MRAFHNSIGYDQGAGKLHKTKQPSLQRKSHSKKREGARPEQVHHQSLQWPEENMQVAKYLSASRLGLRLHLTAQWMNVPHPKLLRRSLLAEHLVLCPVGKQRGTGQAMCQDGWSCR